MTNPSPNLVEKIETLLLGQVSKIAYQIGYGMFVCRSAMSLENGNSLGGPGNVVGFISHAQPRIT
jgi:hypothetical protein